MEQNMKGAIQISVVSAALLAAIVSAAGAEPQTPAKKTAQKNSVTPFPTNNDPANQIRFKTAAEADARRAKLVNFIWTGGLPKTLPAVARGVDLPAEAIAIDPGNVASVDRLDANVSGWNFHAFTYLLYPTNRSNADRVVIVHQGHAGTTESGVGAAANHLLQNGFTVALMQMPLFGWNTDRAAEIPGRGRITFRDHGQIIYKTALNDDGQGFRLFLEPIVQTINHVEANMKGLKEIGMVGLSGGGWTASMAAAIDPRIKLSAPIAGSAPLYHRNVDPSSIGDPEQYFLPLFREDIAADGNGGGIATWTEIYALGGYGKGRHQIQVTNEFDSCCFSGRFADKYKTIVADTVQSLGAGKWEYLLDSTHNAHLISRHAIANAINPLFDIAKPTPTPSGLPIHDDFNNQEAAFPTDWAADPHNGGGFSAVEKKGGVTIRGKALASLVRTVPFNPQRGQPITITMKLLSMSGDNFAGVFITDEIGPRPHHLGVLLEPRTGAVVLNADNGGGFSTASDRVQLGTLDGYKGGSATITLAFDADGFTVKIDAEGVGRFDSGQHRWSEVPGGFDPAKLGEHAHLYLQSYDTAGEEPAEMTVDSISVSGSK
jgi:dienelactone hydrolase